MTMKKYRNIFMLSLCVLGASFLASCDSEDHEQSNNKNVVKVDDIKLQVDQLELELGNVDEMTITPTITPSSVTAKDLIWISEDPSVAYVDSEGKVKALRDGSTNILVKSQDGKQVAVCKIVVSHVKLSTVQLDKHEVTISENGTVTLSAVVGPDNAAYKNLGWKSTDESIVTVKDGVVTGITAGEAEVIVTSYDGVTDKCKVTVTTNENVSFKPFEEGTLN